MKSVPAPRLHIVDVFASEPYTGNPLAVVSRPGALDGGTMQQIALEMNYSETTFVVDGAAGDTSFGVRIFTPTAEIPFAGHPTLGTAHVLLRELGWPREDRVVLQLGVGPVEVRADIDDGVEWLWMVPPTPKLGPALDAALGARLLGLEPDAIDPRWPVCEANVGISFVMVPLRSLEALGRCRLDAQELARTLARGSNAIGVFPFVPAAREPGHDVAARMFFESQGVREDPATGSACTCLAGYLLEHEVLGRGDVEARVEQGYEMGRPSLLRLRAQRGADGVRVEVGGRVITTARGELA